MQATAQADEEREHNAPLFHLCVTYKKGSHPRYSPLFNGNSSKQKNVSVTYM